MATEDASFYISLSKNPIRFEPVSKVSNVFFDDANRQVSFESVSVFSPSILLY